VCGSKVDPLPVACRLDILTAPRLGSLLSSAVVTLTITFTTFDALYNHPSTCNSLLAAEASSDSVRTFFGLMLSAVAVTRCAYMIITNDLVETGGRQMPTSTVDAGAPPTLPAWHPCIRAGSGLR
jgi:hypothetical protein